MYAIAEGPHAEPADADRMRNGDHRRRVPRHGGRARRRCRRRAVRSTKTRLWPHRSPALPNAGPTTPKASIGPVIAQLSTLTEVSRSSAMRCSDTTRIVTVKLTVNSPPSTTHSTAHRRSIPIRRRQPTAQQDRPRHHTELVDARGVEGQGPFGAGCTFSRPCDATDRPALADGAWPAVVRTPSAGSGWCRRASGGTPTVSDRWRSRRSSERRQRVGQLGDAPPSIAIDTLASRPALDHRDVAALHQERLAGEGARLAERGRRRAARCWPGPTGRTRRSLGVMMSSRPGVASVSRVRAPGAIVLLFTL